MAGRKNSKFSAGGGNKLSIIRYGRERMDKYERPANSDIMPGEAVMATTDGSGDPVFDVHNGNTEEAVYVAVEARGRGMDAQTSDGYSGSDDDMVIAVRAAGGGLNLVLATGENVSEADSQLVPDPGGSGEFVEYDSGTHDADDIVATASEDLDLSGASSTSLVGAEMEGK